VRDIAEGMGAKASYEKGVVIIETEFIDDAERSRIERIASLNQTKSKLVEEKERLSTAIDTMEEDIVKQETEMSKYTQEWVKLPFQNTINNHKAGIAKNQERI